MEEKKEQLQRIIIQGFELLQKEKAYQQVNILRKLKTLGQEISAPSLSNILAGKTAGMLTLRKAGKGIREIVLQELQLIYDDESRRFISPDSSPDERPATVPEDHPDSLFQDGQPTYLAEGRPSIQDKVEFLSSAQREVSELGVRLKTFTDYFFSRSEHEFARPVKKLLKRGVNLNLFLLHPECNEAHLYFRDRGKVMEQEKDSVEEIRRVLERLRHIHHAIQQEQFRGQLKVFTYKHIPYNHFLLVDAATPQAKMMVSHYMYGIRRAECPVITFSKQSNYDLFRRYHRSFKALIENGSLLEW